MIPWELRRGQIKHLLYEQCLNGRISWEVFKEHLHELNKVAPVVRCKDCKHFGEVDNEKPEYHECRRFSNWATAHYMLENDFCSCAERKEVQDE